jgi:hypothetical protein
LIERKNGALPFANMSFHKIVNFRNDGAIHKTSTLLPKYPAKRKNKSTKNVSLKIAYLQSRQSSQTALSHVQLPLKLRQMLVFLFDCF